MKLFASNSGDSGNGSTVGVAAIKWGAIVIIVVAILYFFARYIIPLIPSGR